MAKRKFSYLGPKPLANWKTLSMSLMGFLIAASISHIALNSLGYSSTDCEPFFNVISKFFRWHSFSMVTGSRCSSREEHNWYAVSASWFSPRVSCLIVPRSQERRRPSLTTHGGYAGFSSLLPLSYSLVQQMAFHQKVDDEVFLSCELKGWFENAIADNWWKLIWLKQD